MSLLSLTGRRWELLSERDDHLSASSLAAPVMILRMLQEHRRLHHGNTPYDASLFPDTERAIERVQRAIRTGERITLFGDYDCDGITATAQLVRYFQRRGHAPRVRLPHRMREGYGLKSHHIEECISDGTTLLITADTGITCVRETLQAQAAGIDVIILDHHHVQEEIPSAVAILHPLLAGNFPEPHPAAAGVVALFVQALEAADGSPQWPDAANDYALAMIGTVADLVPLTGGNRALVEQGLRAYRSINNGPLSLLAEQAGLTSSMTSRDIAFRIAPRINAAGRMDDPHIALQALLGDPGAIMRLEELNKQRQARVQELWEELKSTIDASAPFLAVASDRYSPGIVGLLAGKLTEAYGRPSFVGGIQGDRIIGSLRSIPGYNIAEGLTRAAEYLEHFGGHAQAAGCSLVKGNLESFVRRMAEDVTATVEPEQLNPTLIADMVLHHGHVNLQLCTHLAALEPHGQGNPEPRFILPGVLLSDARGVGGSGTHLQARVHGQKAIGFGLAHLLPHTNEPADLLCRLGVDTYGGRTGVQIFIDDIRVSQSVGNTKAVSGKQEPKAL